MIAHRLSAHFVPPVGPLTTRLATDGWVLLPATGQAGLDAALAELSATVLYTTEVVVREGRALVTSDRALAFHTDHHRADLIAWLCLAQTTDGGASRLADASAAFASMTPEQQALLAGIRLFEHSVFPGDVSTYPLVERTPRGPRFYFSFWLDHSHPLRPAEKVALDAFEAAVRHHQVANFRLAPGDVLLIDNRRILHGRSAITGSRDRHLVRHWLTLP